MVIGLAGEKQATIRRGAHAITAVYQARVPMAEVILRRVFGVGGAGMTNRHRLVRRWAWPSGDWGSLPVEGGIEAAYRAEIEAADDPVAHIETVCALGAGPLAISHRETLRGRGRDRPSGDAAAAVRVGAQRLSGTAVVDGATAVRDTAMMANTVELNDLDIPSGMIWLCDRRREAQPDDQYHQWP